MRTPLSSPFSPGSDTVPSVWAGRVAQLADWRDVVRPRRLDGIHERGRTILGEAGTGKSALVRRIAQDAVQRGDWVTPQIRIPVGGDPLVRLASELLSLADQAGLPAARERRIGDLLRLVEGIAASGVSLTLREAAGPEPYTALSSLLVEVGREALRLGDTMVVIHVDEVQNITDDARLSQLLVALGDVLAHEEPVRAPGGLVIDRALPIAVYLTGLPEFADMAGARTGATFARRFQTVTLDAIDDDDLFLALQPFVLEGWEVVDAHGARGRVLMEPAASRAIVRLSHGEPFLFQLAGERAWYAATDDVVTESHVLAGWRGAAYEAEAHVQRILERLPAREREFIEVMAGIAPGGRNLTAIARAMGYGTASAAGPTSQRLDGVRGIIKRGKEYRFRNRAVEAYLGGEWPFEAS